MATKSWVGRCAGVTSKNHWTADSTSKKNSTNAPTGHVCDRTVHGNIRDFFIEPCQTVGRPIFFSVLIMLLSFVAVFMVSGRDGKYFPPLAFTKSLAMIGVALISAKLVPA